MADKSPLVSVAVLCYNSSSTILETLDSIYIQTYSPIELIVSDDCSTDNTIEIVEQWIDSHRDRFVRAIILKPAHNTGQSANYNRAFDACEGEWIKEIDGDDKLTTTCIEDLIKYVKKEHPDAVYVFGRIKAFGGNEHERTFVENQLFDYTFFQKSPKEQLRFLIHERNCVPSPGSFYNRQAMKEIGFRCDERIPYLEDYPKWINLLKAGVKYNFMDKVVAEYRVDSGISNGIASPRYYETNRKFFFLYQFPEWVKENEEDAYARLLEHEKSVYQQYYNKENEISRLRDSKAYRIGKKITALATCWRKRI